MIQGRIVHSPSIPDDYDPPKTPYESTIKCQWRSKDNGEEDFGTWHDDGVAFVNPTTPPAHQSTDLPNVDYRYFSMPLQDSQSRIYELQFYYDQDGDNTNDDSEESITVYYTVLDPPRVSEKVNTFNFIYNKTLKDPYDAPLHKLHIVADSLNYANVKVSIPATFGPGAASLMCAVFDQQGEKIGDSYSFDKLGRCFVSIDCNGLTTVKDFFLRVGHDLDGNGELDTVQSGGDCDETTPVCVNDIRKSGQWQDAVVRVYSCGVFNDAYVNCRSLSRASMLPNILGVPYFYGCTLNFFRHFMDEPFGVVYTPDMLHDHVSVKAETDDPLSATSFTGWLTHNAGCIFSQSGVAEIPRLNYSAASEYAKKVVTSTTFNPSLRDYPLTPVAGFYNNMLAPGEREYYKLHSGAKQHTWPEDGLLPFYFLADESSAPGFDVTIGNPSISSLPLPGVACPEDAYTAFGRVRIISIGRQFKTKVVNYMDGIGGPEKPFVVLEKVRVVVVIEDLYDFYIDDQIATHHLKWATSIVPSVTAGDFGQQQVAFGDGRNSHGDHIYDSGKVFAVKVVCDKWFDIPKIMEEVYVPIPIE